ncbi:MAG: zinc ribbon domain-containing protein [Gammaproteobacteria bacterium]|nr:zinc ribbon domain-containing protein [Gammaproteobacteria bacterium]
MPIYEYQCRACGHGFETIQKFSDDPLVDCPACEKPDLKKLVSRVAFRLKGSGWYETDFKKEGKRNVVDADSSDTKTDEPSGDQKAKAKKENGKTEKTDSKPEPKTPKSSADSSTANS